MNGEINMNGEKQKVNIYELAKATGFSPSTVSKALNNTGRISEATKVKILEKAKELNYVASYHAKALSLKKSWLIAIIHSDDLGIGLSHPHFSVILENFKQEVEKAGYEVTFVNRNMGQTEMTYLEFCRYRNVEGVFLVNYYPFSRQLPELIASDLPIVSAEIGDGGVTSVTSDDYLGGKLAAEYLHNLGHKTFGYLSASLSSAIAIERLNGYKEFLDKKDIENVKIYESANFGFEDGYRRTIELIENGDLPSALFASGDLLALGAIKAFKDNGIRVPEDISVIGFDDLEFLKFNNPALTTIAQNKKEIGITAAQFLMDKISGEERDSVRIPVQVIERETCMKVK